MDGDDEVVGRDELELPLPEIELVDMRGPESQRPLTDVFSEASVSDRIDWVNGLLAQVIPDFRRLEIIGVGSGFEVAVNAKGGTVPLSLSGDGLRALARLGLELSAASMGTVLLEEPEVHQHPRSLRQSATVIVEAVKRGVQVVVATHSLELIDELLLAAAAGGSIDALSVQKLRLQGGVLRTTSFSGNESDRIRNEIGTELR